MRFKGAVHAGRSQLGGGRVQDGDICPQVHLECLCDMVSTMKSPILDILERLCLHRCLH